MLIESGLKFTSGKQLLILIAVTLGLNFNTLFNKYVLDDAVVMTENSLVEKGIKGIPEIMTTDLFYGIANRNIDLSGGRYRPLPIAIFAIEHQFFGENPMVSHLINLLLFIILVSLLYKLLNKYLFRNQNKYFSFVTCLLFIVHPLHTEVTANVKGRDEILVFILLISSLIFLINYWENTSRKYLAGSLLFFFLALFARESAVPFIAVVPLIAYYLYGQTIRQALLKCVPFMLVFSIYLLIRFSVSGIGRITNPDILNFPFVYATNMEAFATKTYILLRYALLLFYPSPLSYDYSYNQVPYINIYSLLFVISFIVVIGFLIYALIKFRERTIFSFCILYFIITIFPFSNFIYDIGAPLAERLLFQPSLAFCIFLSSVFFKMYTRNKFISKGILFILLVLFSIKTFSRNQEWKNNETLFLKDVISSPNSIRTNMFAATVYIEKAQKESNPELREEYFRKAIHFDETVLKMYRHYVPVYQDLSIAYFGLNDFFKSAENNSVAISLDSTDSDSKNFKFVLSNILFEEGDRYFKKDNNDSAIFCFKKSVELNSNKVESWYKLGGCYFVENETANGIESWKIVLKLSPQHPLDKAGFFK